MNRKSSGAEVREDRNGRRYAVDDRGKRIKVKEAERRIKIGDYANRRHRDRTGKYAKKRFVITSGWRAKEGTDYGFGKVTEVETDLENPKDEDLLKAADMVDQDYTHFGVMDRKETGEW